MQVIMTQSQYAELPPDVQTKYTLIGESTVTINGEKGYSYEGPDISEGEVIETSEQRIFALEEENALLALELATAQSRLDQTEQEQAALLLELVSREVI